MSRLVFQHTRAGRAYAQNFDRQVIDEALPLFAVMDSECDDGTAGDIVSAALLDSRRALLVARERGSAAVRDVLVGAVRAAHDRIVAIPRGTPGNAGGAAVTALSSSGDTAVVVHVGDCRLYLREEAGWVRRTTDHTLREEARNAGDALSDFAQRGPFADPRFQVGVVLSVVGLSRQLSRIDTVQFPIDGPCSVLLCTRGAWMPLDPSGEATPLPGSLDATEVARFVLAHYERAGERDNATVVVAQLEPG
jgi:serine/threonine protein phosphatase PrpC